MINWLEVALISFIGLLIHEALIDYGRKKPPRKKPHSRTW